MSKLAIRRYIWLIDTVYQAGENGITFEQICELRKNGSFDKESNYPLRTFHNHRQEIRESFNINIQCNKSTNCYFISKEDNNVLQQKLLALISMTNYLESHTSMSDCVVAEHPFMGEHLIATLLPAIENHRNLQVKYHPYWSEKILNYTNFEPYGLKEHHRSWYLLGKRGENPLEMIDLKNVTSINETGESFSPDTGIQVKKVLNENFGACIEDINTEEIMIKVMEPSAGFLRSNPLHRSQKEIEKKKNYSIFYLYLKPNSEFVRELLALGGANEVLTPESLKISVAQEAKKIVKKNS